MFLLFTGQNISEFEKVLRTIRELWYTPHNNTSNGVTDVQYLHNYYKFIQRYVWITVSTISLILLISKLLVIERYRSIEVEIKSERMNKTNENTYNSQKHCQIKLILLIYGQFEN